MAWQERKYKLTGMTPMIMHNGQMASPINKWARLIKGISSKRNKTDADYEEMARLEFFGSLYMSKDDGPIVPAKNLTALIINGAKKERKGKDAGAGIFVTDHARLDYDGPRTVEELWESEEFISQEMVNVQRSKVLRTRPIFEDWSLVLHLEYEDTLVNTREIDRWLEIAGLQIGLGDWRPQYYGRYGRFNVEAV